MLTNAQIAAVRDVTDRYAGTGRVLTHTIVHPNYGPHELDAMETWRTRLDPSGWKVYTLYGPPTKASPTGGWYLDDDEIGMPFLEHVNALGPRVVAAHKGLGGPIPDQSVAAASPRDIGPAAAAYPGIKFVVYHSGYERDPHGQEGPYDAAHADYGVDRLVKSLETAGLGAGANVYAELGSTWFLMLRRPLEAAHVLGKLMLALGPERIVWGTDSTWYGSPQPLIDAFRAFRIPERLQREHGYPPLTHDVKERILSTNAQAVYEVSDQALSRADRIPRSFVGGQRIGRATPRDTRRPEPHTKARKRSPRRRRPARDRCDRRRPAAATNAPRHSTPEPQSRPRSERAA